MLSQEKKNALSAAYFFSMAPFWYEMNRIHIFISTSMTNTCKKLLVKQLAANITKTRT